MALCISHPLVAFSDWSLVFTRRNLVLAVPGLLAGLILTYVSRKATNEAMLPLTMVGIPALFYIFIFTTGVGLDGAREGGWVGEVSPPVPVTDLFQLVDLSLVQWDLMGKVGWTWVGMVFVVSFASCLDVAAISMDKGEALDTNRELATVGIGNRKCLGWSCWYSHNDMRLLIPSSINSNVWFDVWIYGELHFLADHLYVSNWCPFKNCRMLDHGRVSLHCCFAN